MFGLSQNIVSALTTKCFAPIAAATGAAAPGRSLIPIVMANAIRKSAKNAGAKRFTNIPLYFADKKGAKMKITLQIEESELHTIRAALRAWRNLNRKVAKESPYETSQAEALEAIHLCDHALDATEWSESFYLNKITQS